MVLNSFNRQFAPSVDRSLGDEFYPYPPELPNFRLAESLGSVNRRLVIDPYIGSQTPPANSLLRHTELALVTQEPRDGLAGF